MELAIDRNQALPSSQIEDEHLALIASGCSRVRRQEDLFAKVINYIRELYRNF
jgi:hypothetical protein